MRTEKLVTSISRDDLEAAIESGEIYLAFQPKVNCRTHSVAAFEALARWTHPKHGAVPPSVFIPLAERAGLIHTLTLQVIDQGLRWLKSLRHEKALYLCINLSTVVLDDAEFLSRATDLCQEHGISTGSVIFELNETRAIAKAARTLEFVTRLRVKGFSVAIDDVGSGYSSLMRLSTLPFSQMKIDKAILLGSTSSRKLRFVLENLVEMGHSLGLVVVAEGIENETNLELVETVGCDLVQGHYIASPMTGDDARNWYASH